LKQNADDLLSSLHALGVGLWYKEMEEFDTMVLNPEWISHGVYKIINWLNNEKRYLLPLDEFSTVFKDEAIRFPADKHEFIFRLMIHYELAYKTDKRKCLIVPHLLKEDQPANLPSFPVGESLMARYKAYQPLPPNTISRFIVRHNQEIRKEAGKYLVWRKGVILQDGSGSLALVREEDRTITVSVKGDNRTEYISSLRETLNDIFNSYKSNKPELQYRIERFGLLTNEMDTENPLWLKDRMILTYAMDHMPYYDENTRQYIPLQLTQNTYNITGPTLLGGQGNQFLDQSIHNTFNFKDCNITLQGSLNELAGLLKESGKRDAAKELESAVKALEEAEKCKTREEVKKKGIAGKLKRLVEDMGDDNSKLHKMIEGLKYGIGIAQDIAKGYNEIAQWCGLPQVPKPFLGKKN
jgi:hypothetical protein